MAHSCVDTGVRRHGRRSAARALVGAACVLLLVTPAQAARAPSLRLGKASCPLIAVPTAGKMPVGTGTCSGVRPGALIETPNGFCTLNFVFRGSDNRNYVGTAGHCVLGQGPIQQDAGETVWKTGGPWAKDSTGRTIGNFVYAVLQSPKDFALIRLNSGIAVDPQMCFFGGPTGINTSTKEPAVLHYYGNGLGIGDVLPARTAMAPSMSSPDHVYAYGAIMQGDSGSGIISRDGLAVGVIVTLGVNVQGLDDHGPIGITRLAPQLARAKQLLEINLTLRTAPLL